MGADMKEKLRESQVSLPRELVLSEGDRGGWQVAGWNSHCALVSSVTCGPRPAGSARGEDTPVRVLPVGSLSECIWKGRERADTFWG